MNTEQVNTTELQNGNRVLYAGNLFELSNRRPVPPHPDVFHRAVQFDTKLIKALPGNTHMSREHAESFKLRGNIFAKWDRVVP